MASRQVLFDRLVAAEASRMVEVGVELRRLNRPDSPVFSRADNATPLFASVGAALAALYFGGWVWAMAIAGSAAILMLTGVNYVVMRRLRRRALAYALAGPEGWQRLWDMGGLSLRLPGRNDTQAVSPDEDWGRFAARHLRRAGSPG